MTERIGDESEGGDQHDVLPSLPDDRSVGPLHIRLSPYALTAFVVGLFALYRSSSALSLFTLPLYDVIRDVVQATFVPVAAAMLALWLATQARREMAASGAHLIGSAFARAAQWLATFALVAVASGVVLQLALDPQPDVIEVPVPSERLIPPVSPADDDGGLGGVRIEIPSRPPAPAAPARPVGD